MNKRIFLLIAVFAALALLASACEFSVSTANIADAYLVQMALYRAVLAQAFPGRAIRCALLWTEAPILMEAPPGALDRALGTLVS